MDKIGSFIARVMLILALVITGASLLVAGAWLASAISGQSVIPINANNSRGNWTFAIVCVAWFLFWTVVLGAIAIFIRRRSDQ